MARRDAETPPATRFRRAAEARVAAQIPPAGSSSGEEAARLLHELQVHEVELELQNEELRRAQDALAAEQRALAESQSRFREIADHVEDFFYIRDLDGRLTYAGAAFDRIWGRPASAFAGKPEAWMETIDPEDRARVAEAWRRLRAGTAINETYRIRRPDESVRWANVFLIAQGDRFFLLNEKGDLIIARLTPQGYEEIDRAHILDPTDPSPGRLVVWSHPAFANKSMYARNDKEIVCVSLAK